MVASLVDFRLLVVDMVQYKYVFFALARLGAIHEPGS